jgi:putative hemolysin
MKLVEIKDLEAVSPVFRGKWGNRLAKFCIRLFGFEKVNRVYDGLSHFKGVEFTTRWFEKTGVKYIVGNAERLKHLPDGAFITISNHAYGGLDGVIMIDFMVRIRPDYKFMVNRLLGMIKTMNDNFISVSPTGNKKTEVSVASLSGVRETMKSLRGGHPVGFFPSGAVSDFSFRDMRVRDREWQESVLNLIHHAKVPIIPIRFFDQNSTFFYFLGVISWRIRVIRMAHELFNKNKKPHRLGIGHTISIEEQKQFTDIKSFGEFLRKAVYDMPLPGEFIPLNQLDLL